MRFEGGFYQTDINIYYDVYDGGSLNSEINSDFYKTHYNYNDNVFKLFWLINGECSLINEDYYTKIKENSFAFAGPNTKFSINPSFKQQYKFLYINVHSSVFTSQNCENNFFRVFDNIKGKEALFNLNKPEYKRLVCSLETMLQAITLQYGRCHIQALTTALITEMSILYDCNHKIEADTTTSVPVNVMKYIARHYTENINYATISNKYFISVPTINTIVKNYSGKTFWNYITELRLNDARMMLKSKDYPVSTIAKLCGFSNYSTFYRAYLKCFGITPSNEKIKTTKKWPLHE